MYVMTNEWYIKIQKKTLNAGMHLCCQSRTGCQLRQKSGNWKGSLSHPSRQRHASLLHGCDRNIAEVCDDVNTNVIIYTHCIGLVNICCANIHCIMFTTCSSQIV